MLKLRFYFSILLSSFILTGFAGDCNASAISSSSAAELTEEKFNGGISILTRVAFKD